MFVVTFPRPIATPTETAKAAVETTEIRATTAAVVFPPDLLAPLAKPTPDFISCLLRNDGGYEYFALARIADFNENPNPPSIMLTRRDNVTINYSFVGATDADIAFDANATIVTRLLSVLPTEWTCRIYWQAAVIFTEKWNDCNTFVSHVVTGTPYWYMHFTDDRTKIESDDDNGFDVNETQKIDAGRVIAFCDTFGGNGQRICKHTAISLGNGLCVHRCGMGHVKISTISWTMILYTTNRVFVMLETVYEYRCRDISEMSCLMVWERK